MKDAGFTGGSQRARSREGVNAVSGVTCRESLRVAWWKSLGSVSYSVGNATLEGALQVGDDGDEDAEVNEFEVGFDISNTIRQVQFVLNCARSSYVKYCSIFVLIIQLSKTLHVAKVEKICMVQKFVSSLRQIILITTAAH